MVIDYSASAAVRLRRNRREGLVAVVQQHLGIWQCQVRISVFPSDPLDAGRYFADDETKRSGIESLTISHLELNRMGAISN